MDIREKLVELLAKYFDIGDSYAYNLTRVKSASACGTVGLDDFEEFDDETIEDIASYLIDNGVTVQKWIPVTERLPEAGGYVACMAKRNPFSRFVPVVARIERNGWVNPITEQYISEVTHWMPLPNPPKGEC